MSELDLHAYFDRIEWGGDPHPTLDTLTSLLAAHMAHVPFENLDVLLGRRIRLDLDGVQHKLVRQRRGGYCFEHGTLFAAVLEDIGFQPVRHTARVTLLAPRQNAPRSHMFLTVPLPEGTFVVDPGFGSLAARVPVPLDGREARIDGERHQIRRDGPLWILKATMADKTVDAWVSTLEEDFAVDYEMGNHFTSTHPTSAFVNRILLRALTPRGRVSVMNRDVNTVTDGVPQPSKLPDRAALRALLVAHFGFDLPEVETLRVPTIPEWT